MRVVSIIGTLTLINNNNTMEQEEIKRKLYSSVLFLAAHPEQVLNSEMKDRLDDLIDIYNHLNQ